MKNQIQQLLRRFGLGLAVVFALAVAPLDAVGKPLLTYGKTSAKQKSLRLQTGETAAEFDFAGLSTLPLGSAFDFNQPDGSLIPMQLDRIEVGASGAKTYIARITEHGTQYRAYFTEFEGHVLANIDLPDTTLKLEPQAGQDAPHQVLLRNTKAAGMKPVESTHSDARYHFPTPEQSLADHFDRIAKGYENPRTPDRSEDHQKVAPSPQTTIDIMVAYTPALVSARSPFTDAGARARIDQLIAYANQGYLDSDIAITLRLVHAVATTYTDTNADDVALDELTGISVTRPASLSSIPTLRDTYGADLVVLLRPYRTAHAYCGVAWVNGAPNSGASIASDAPTGFAVVSEGNNVDGGGSYCHDTSFPHELGHNMGLDHDRAQVRQSVVDSCNAGAGCPTGCVPGNASSPCMTFAAYHYSFGYIGPNFGTIMSYYNGTRLNRFSNPLLSNCSGTGAAPFYVCGVADPDSTEPKYANAGANAALSLNNTRTGVAAFRATVVIATPTNVALQTNGGVATASTTYSASYPASAVNNGDRTSASWGAGGGWNDSTFGVGPDWVQVQFAAAKTISRVDVVTLSDVIGSTAQPSSSSTFSQYGITDFRVQYWNGTSWVDVAIVNGNNCVWKTLTFGAVSTDRVRIQVDAALAGYARIVEVEAWEVGATAASSTCSTPTVPRNVALSTNGGVATASSQYSAAFPVASINNGDRIGASWGNGGGWNDATANAAPDFVEIAFVSQKTIDRVDVITLQDNFSAPAAPTSLMTFQNYGVTHFDVQYWDGTNWITVNGGLIADNNCVWRTVSFPAVSTSKIRISITAALASHSRLVEVEAWETGATAAKSTCGTAGPVNVAHQSNGGIASASSTFSSAFPASAVNNGDRKGVNWGGGGGWNDATGSAYPDWIQVQFTASRVINRIDVFTLQDSFTTAVTPTSTLTFSNYGITQFSVQYFDGTTWITPAGGAISGNNLVWRSISFTPVTTDRVRVLVNGAQAGYSRVVELEAYTP